LTEKKFLFLLNAKQYSTYCIGLWQEAVGYLCDTLLLYWDFLAFSVPIQLVDVSMLLSLSWQILLMMMVVMMGSLLTAQQTDVYRRTVKM